MPSSGAVRWTRDGRAARPQSTTSSSRPASSTPCPRSWSAARASTTGWSGVRGSGARWSTPRAPSSRVHQRHDYAHVPGGFEEAHFGGRGAAERGARRRRRTDLHDLRREPSAAARRHRPAAHRLDVPGPRESSRRPPGSSGSAVGSLRRYPTPTAHPRAEPVLQAWRRGDRQPAGRPLRVISPRSSTSQSSRDGSRAPPPSLAGDAERRAGAPDALDRVRPDEAPFSGDELRHLSRRQHRPRALRRGRRPRALHDGPARSSAISGSWSHGAGAFPLS